MFYKTLKIDDMVLPDYDIIRAVPIKIQIDDKRYLIFEIPTVKEWFDFETKYIKILATYFNLFTGVEFLTYQELSDEKLIQRMIKQLYPAIQDNRLKKELLKLIKKYFKANFNIRKLYKYINVMQLAYIFLLIHSVVENVKKKTITTISQIKGLIQDTFLKSLNEPITTIEPRY